jgi:hypothetical protein
MRTISHVLFASALATAGAFAATSAEAAPQVLGLVASNGYATPLACAEGDCSAILSSFCLQQVRPGPSHGSAYRIAEGVAGGGTITLIAQTADGRTLRLPGAKHLEFTTRIGFTSVRATLPRSTREAFAITQASVEIGPLVSLVPVQAAGDPSPQTAEEVALATGVIRKASVGAFEAPGPLSDAARITSAVVNALPERAADETDGAALWTRAVTPDLASAVTPEGMALAQRLYQGCRISVETHTTMSLRSCLELRHADLMAHRNQEFWQSLGGS